MKADYRLSDSLFDVMRKLADVEAHRRILAPNEAGVLRRAVKDLAIEARKAEHRAFFEVDRRAPPEMRELYAIADGVIDVSKVLMDCGVDPASVTGSDYHAFARRLIDLGGGALGMVREISMHRWNALARQNREDLECQAAVDDAAEREADRPGTNLHLLSRAREGWQP